MKRHQTVCNLGVHGLMANEGYCVKSDGGCYGWRQCGTVQKSIFCSYQRCSGHRWMQVQMQEGSYWEPEDEPWLPCPG